MMSTLTSPIYNFNATAKTQPWFFTQHMNTNNVNNEMDAQTEMENICAEILSSLSRFISSPSDSDSDEGSMYYEGSVYSPKQRDARDFTSLQKKTMKFSKDRKDKVMKPFRFKRNVNACAEHRRKHQKCPMDCPMRRENLFVAEESSS